MFWVSQSAQSLPKSLTEAKRHTHANIVYCAAQDFEKGSVKQFMKSVQYYDELGARLIKAGHCLDVFSCSLDQVGLAEMHPAVNTSGDRLLEMIHMYVFQAA